MRITKVNREKKMNVSSRSSIINSPKGPKTLNCIPFNDYIANKEKKKLDRIQFISSENNTSLLKHIVFDNPKGDKVKPKIFEMRRKLDDIFQTKMTVDKKKMSDVFRKGISQQDISIHLKNNSKISFPSLKQKTQIKKYLNDQPSSSSDKNTIEKNFKKVVEFRKDNIKNNIENLNREVILKYKSKFIAIIRSRICNKSP